MIRLKNKKSLKLFLPAVLALIMIVLIIGSSIGKSENINKNGEKYGKFPTDKGLNQLLESDSLDLIAVVATNGKRGLHQKTDIEVSVPSSPEDAATYVSEDYHVNVYKKRWRNSNRRIFNYTSSFRNALKGVKMNTNKLFKYVIVLFFYNLFGIYVALVLFVYGDTMDLKK